VAGEQLVDVGVSLKGWTSIVFQVKTAANGRILLTTERQNFTGNALYEIVLGVGGSTRSIIR